MANAIAATVTPAKIEHIPMRSTTPPPLFWWRLGALLVGGQENCELRQQSFNAKSCPTISTDVSGYPANFTPRAYFRPTVNWPAKRSLSEVDMLKIIAIGDRQTALTATASESEYAREASHAPVAQPRARPTQPHESRVVG
jgi:hypothetical protein